MPPAVPSFLLGLVVAPVAKLVAKPLALGAVKAAVTLAVEVKKVAHQANEDIHDLAAEVTADMINAELRSDEKAEIKPEKARSGKVTASAH